MLMSIADTFNGNSAVIAGGLIFSTDAASTKFACTPDAVAISNQTCGVQAWTNNTVAATGYGPDKAFPPARLVLTAGPTDAYVSNGMTKLPLAMYIQDDRGTGVTAGVWPQL